MYYISIKQAPVYKQMTLEEFLFGNPTISRTYDNNQTCTRTYRRESIPESISKCINVQDMITRLHEFNTMYDFLREPDRHLLYKTFHIPKKSGGLRRIDAPNEELMDALRCLKSLFESFIEYRNPDNFAVTHGALYHTSAFAYVEGRCTVDAVKRHQQNESKWFAKYDLHNFFGSTTLDYVMKMMGMVFPFCEIIKTNFGITSDNTGECFIYDGGTELKKALELAFLDGCLPQGTPISPLITNIIMIPVDFELANTLRDYNQNKYVYTRYADDFLISSKYDFSFRDIENKLISTLESFNAPFNINSKKTRYGSSTGSGANWNLGLMLNANNEITVGHKNKRKFKTMLFNYAMDKSNGKSWDLYDVQVLEGLRNYYRKVEKESIDEIVIQISQKINHDVLSYIKEDLKQK